MTISKFLRTFLINWEKFSQLERYLQVIIGHEISKLNYQDEFKKLRDRWINSNEMQDDFLSFQGKLFIIFLYSEFEQYLFRCIKFILLNQPEILAKEFPEIEDKPEYFQEERAEKLIHKLSYKKYSEIFNYTKQILKIDHNLNKDDFEKLHEFKQIRNLFAHGDGTITKIFLKRVKESNFKLGDKIKIVDKMTQEIYQIVFKATETFDRALILKYPRLVD